MTQSKTKRCRRCSKPKSIDEFGLNKLYATKGLRDGRNIYCKVCCSAWMNNRRAKDKAAKPPKPKPMVVAKPRPAVGKILTAISEGYRTRELIEQKTKLHEDTISNVLAVLWDEGQVRVRDGQFHFTQKAA